MSLIDKIKTYARTAASAALVFGLSSSTSQQMHAQSVSQSQLYQQSAKSNQELTREQELALYDKLWAQIRAATEPVVDETQASLKNKLSIMDDAVLTFKITRPAYLSADSWKQSHETALLTRAGLCDKLGLYPRSISDYNAILLLSDSGKPWEAWADAPILVRRGIAKSQQGLLSSALGDFFMAGSIGGRDSEPWRHRAELLYRLGRPEEAMADCEHAIKYTVPTPALFALKAKIHRDFDQPIASFTSAKKAVEANPEYVEGHIEFALAHLACSKQTPQAADYYLKGALSELNKAIELNPKNAKAYGHRAQLHFEATRYAQASSDFATARKQLKKSNLEQIVDTGGFNVLESAIWDAERNQLIFAGRKDPSYTVATIPYYDLLKTAFEHPNPAISIEPTAESRKSKDAMFARMGGKFTFTPQEQERFVRITANAQAYLATLVLAQSSDSKDGFKVRFHKNGGYLQSDLFWNLAWAFDISQEIKLILEGKGTAEIHARAAEKMTGIPRLYEDYGTAYAKRDANAIIGLFNKIKDNADAYHTNRNFFAGPKLMWAMLDVELVSRPEYLGVPDNSQFARVLYESDFWLKHLIEKPGVVPGHKTHIEWVREMGVPAHEACRFWISPEKIDIATSADGNVYSFKNALLKIEAKVEDGRGGEFSSQGLSKYAALLTQQYEQYARKYPSIHELREASKILALSKILKSKGQVPALPEQIAWKSPSQVDGFFTLFVDAKDREKTMVSYSGGVNFRNVENKTELYVSPEVPRPRDVGIQNKRGYQGNDFTLTINQKPLTAIVPRGTAVPGTKQDAERQVQQLEALVSETKTRLQDLSNGVQLNKKSLDPLVSQQSAYAEEWRLAAAELLLQSGANWQEHKKNAPELMKNVDLPVASKTFSSLVFGKAMTENAENKDFAEAATEGTLYFADAALDAWNTVMGDPAFNSNAANWAVSGKIIQAYGFTKTAIDNVNAAHKFYESKHEIEELLRNIDDAAELQKTLSKIHKKRVDDLNKAKEELKKFNSK